MVESSPNAIRATDDAIGSGGDGDDGLDHVVADGRRHDPADAALQHRPAVVGEGDGGGHQQVHPSPEQQSGSTDEHEPEELVERGRQVRVREAVPGATTVGNGLHETASAQARQLVRHDLPRDPEGVGEVGRVGRRLAERQEDARPGRIRKRVAESREGGGVRDGRGRGRHGHDSTAIRELTTACTDDADFPDIRITPAGARHGPCCCGRCAPARPGRAPRAWRHVHSEPSSETLPLAVPRPRT